MPVASTSRQYEPGTGPLAWFGSEAGQGLLAVQEAAIGVWQSLVEDEA